jgi:hypothetical protein
MQSLHASARSIEHTSLQSIVTTRDAASSSQPSLLRNALQNPHRHPPLVAASRFRTVACQAASSHWVCAGCSSRFLAGDQKLWGPSQAAVERLASARIRTRTVTGQWFHFKSRKSLNVPVREESPGIDEYLRVSYFPYAPVGSSPIARPSNCSRYASPFPLSATCSLFDWSLDRGHHCSSSLHATVLSP